MAVSDHDMIEAWKQVLSLSRLAPGQIVTVLTGASTHAQTMSTAITAVQMLGATANRLDLQPVNGEKAISRDSLAYLGTTPLTNNRAAIAALKESDLVLDLMTLLFSPEQHEILKAGTKILLAVEPPEVLVRMVPNAADRIRVKRAADRMAVAKEMHIVSAAGTDLRCGLGEFPAIAEYGLVDEPGRWDHWPSGFALTWPNEGGTNGTLVIDRGDIILPIKAYVQDPIHVTVENGFVTGIKGSFDAQLLAGYMASFNDPDAYAMSHVGWGLQPRAHWSALAMYNREATIGMDARAYEGNFLFSFGPNNEAGGQRAPACHIDIPLRNCTVSLDGEIMVDNGKVCDAEAQRQPASNSKYSGEK